MSDRFKRNTMAVLFVIGWMYLMLLMTSLGYAHEFSVVRFMSYEFTTPETSVRVQLTPDNRIHVYQGTDVQDLKYIGTRYDFCQAGE